jgi:hypothetical protein
MLQMFIKVNFFNKVVQNKNKTVQIKLHSFILAYFKSVVGFTDSPSL